MVIGERKCSWNLGYRSSILLGWNAQGQQITLNFPDEKVTKVPIFSGCIRLSKNNNQVTWVSDHGNMTLKVRGGFHRLLLDAVVNRPDEFYVRDKKVYGTWNFLSKRTGSYGASVLVHPIAKSVKYAEVERYRESLPQWFVENQDAEIS